MSFFCSRDKIKDGDEQIIRGGFGGGGAAAPAAMRKGPWTEEEDAQLVRFVRLFGERRWDFLAKVSGLRRTGKSCRLRWVNYLHPDLRRGRITADEERLIVQLHAQWGSRWSRIARSIPGRTDNEIKNFWRTRTRKHKAALQAERPRGKTAAAAAVASPMSSVTTASYCCPGSPNSRASDDSALRECGGGGSADGEEDQLEEASTAAAGAAASQHEQPPEYCCAMDQLWNEIAEADAAAAAAGYLLDGWGAGHCYYGGGAAAEPPSPVWEYFQDFSLWRIDDEEYFKEMLDAS